MWLAIGYRERTCLVFLSGRQKNTGYIQLLNFELLPNISSELELGWVVGLRPIVRVMDLGL